MIQTKEIKHIALFEGIGGFSLAAQWMGWHTKLWIENNPFCQNTLRKNFKNAIGHSDIRDFDGTPYRGQFEILTGGFPCQPYSLSGNRQGSNDERALWGEMFRVVKEVEPSFVVAENVYGIINIEDGLVFEGVCLDLESQDYEVQPYIIPACAINAPHQRNRVWIVAKKKGCDKIRHQYAHTNTNGIGHQKQGYQLETDWNRQFDEDVRYRNWLEAATQLCRVDDGLSKKLDNERIAALGNAIVPQIAYIHFKAIMDTWLMG